MRDDAPDKPVAAFYKEKRYLHMLRMSQHPYLEIHASVLECLDYVIGMSWLHVPFSEVNCSTYYQSHSCWSRDSVESLGLVEVLGG